MGPPGRTPGPPVRRHAGSRRRSPRCRPRRARRGCATGTRPAPRAVRAARGGRPSAAPRWARCSARVGPRTTMPRVETPTHPGNPASDCGWGWHGCRGAEPGHSGAPGSPPRSPRPDATPASPRRSVPRRHRRRCYGTGRGLRPASATAAAPYLRSGAPSARRRATHPATRRARRGCRGDRLAQVEVQVPRPRIGPRTHAVIAPQTRADPGLASMT